MVALNFRTVYLFGIRRDAEKLARICLEIGAIKRSILTYFPLLWCVLWPKGIRVKKGFILLDCLHHSSFLKKVREGTQAGSWRLQQKERPVSEASYSLASYDLLLVLPCNTKDCHYRRGLTHNGVELSTIIFNLRMTFSHTSHQSDKGNSGGSFCLVSLVCDKLKKN